MRYSLRGKVPIMSSVPAEILDIVHRLRELSEAGRLDWKESSRWIRPRGGQVVEVALASGLWLLKWSPGEATIGVTVWGGNGDRLFTFDVADDDQHFAEFKAIYDAAIRHNQERITSTALNAMREELAAR